MDSDKCLYELFLSFVEHQIIGKHVFVPIYLFYMFNEQFTYVLQVSRVYKAYGLILTPFFVMKTKSFDL